MHQCCIRPFRNGRLTYTQRRSCHRKLSSFPETTGGKGTVRMSLSRLLALSALLILVGFSGHADRSGTKELCTVGLYSGPGNAFIAVTISENGYEYVFDTGEFGKAGEPDAPVRCISDALKVYDAEVWPRLPLRETGTFFESEGVSLAGRLIEAKQTGGPAPLVVFAHGSERSGWLDRARDPYMLVGRGVSVFVYDKRGTGQSGGTYNQNFSLLAKDLAAAATEARRLADGRFDRLGLIGLSQGGWVVPLAASQAKADFLGVAYGLVMDIREEDAAQVELELREAGYDEDVIALGRKLTDATARVATETSTEAIAAFDSLRMQLAGNPWLEVIRGDYSGLLLQASREEIEKVIIPEFKRYDVDWSLDPIAIVREAHVPQLWIFAAEDRTAPPGISIKRLKAIQNEGRDISIRVFPNTDHGMQELPEAFGGNRTFTRIAPGYYDMLADWAFDDLQGPYGMAEER